MSTEARVASHGASPSPPAGPVCSIIVPIYNAEPFLAEALRSIAACCAPALHRVQLVIYNDGSTDGTAATLAALRHTLPPDTKIIHGPTGPLGVGTARNRACEAADAPILVFHDADDVMRPDRVSRTLEAFRDTAIHVLGGVFDRIPAGSTPRYEAYHRRLTSADLFVYAFRDAPLAFPTVACRKSVWQTIRFREGTGIPEDLHFLYDAMAHGYTLHKLNGHSLTGYRYHPNMTSLTLHRRVLLDVRVAAFEKLVLSKPSWQGGFSIWGCGRDGKDVYRRLSDASKKLLHMWGDIDPRKIGNTCRGCPVVHFRQLKPPIVCAVAMDRDGAFEKNLALLNITPGHDYVHLV